MLKYTFTQLGYSVTPLGCSVTPLGYSVTPLGYSVWSEFSIVGPNEVLFFTECKIWSDFSIFDPKIHSGYKVYAFENRESFLTGKIELLLRLLLRYLSFLAPVMHASSDLRKANDSSWSQLIPH